MKYSKIIASCKYFIDRFGDDCMESDHDVLFGPSEHPDDLDEATISAMNTLGWHWSDQYDCWITFT